MRLRRFLSHALMSAAIAAVFSIPGTLSAQSSEAEFEAPEFLKVGDKPMNADGAMLYPSPAIFDVDQDGKNELVIGTIFGQLYTCENRNNSSGDPIWSAPKALETADKEEITLNNW